jgi:hypothetical protein
MRARAPRACADPDIQIRNTRIYAATRQADLSEAILGRHRTRPSPVFPYTGLSMSPMNTTNGVPNNCASQAHDAHFQASTSRTRAAATDAAAGTIIENFTPTWKAQRAWLDESSRATLIEATGIPGNPQSPVRW